MTIVRSKICGITCVADALLAVEAGADAIGLVFFEKSPRAVTPEQARAIVAALPPFVTTVGLFVNAGREAIHDVLRSVPLDVLQFHGDETPQECEGHGRPYFKALRVRAEDDLLALTKAYASAQAILLDAYVPGLHGGTGERFDWSLIPVGLPKPLILAGGLTPHNVREAIAQVRPYAVDVSGGVEASKGRKDAEKVREFIRQVRVAETSM